MSATPCMVPATGTPPSAAGACAGCCRNGWRSPCSAPSSPATSRPTPATAAAAPGTSSCAAAVLLAVSSCGLHRPDREWPHDAGQCGVFLLRVLPLLAVAALGPGTGARDLDHAQPLAG